MPYNIANEAKALLRNLEGRLCYYDLRMLIIMLDGYIRVAATPLIRVADCAHNVEQILILIEKAVKQDVRLLCLPELCITGYTCGDLFLQDTLLESAWKALNMLARESVGYEVLVVAGLPLRQRRNHRQGRLQAAAGGGTVCPVVVRLCLRGRRVRGKQHRHGVRRDNLICENGAILNESPPFLDGWTISELDLKALAHNRRRINIFSAYDEGYTTVPFALETGCRSLSRVIDPPPFVPKDERDKEARCEEILSIQAAGLAKRLERTSCKTAVLGIFGELDSCLTLLVTVRSSTKLGLPLSGILAVTLPCLGTTEQTKSNAYRLCEALGVSCREIDITEPYAMPGWMSWKG